MTAPSELLIRRIAALLATVGAALLVGLAPPIRFQIDATSEPARSTVLSPVYGGHGVQQSLGEPASPILRAKIWAAAGLAGPATLVTTSLVTGDASEPLRQFSFQARPSSEPLPQTLVFQPYELPTGREVRLQLAVSPNAQNFVSFATASFAPSINGEFKQPELDSQPLDFLGPFTYELEGAASGFRAAWFHGGSERVRLAGAVAALLAGLVLRFFGSRIVRLALAVPSIRQRRRTTARVAPMADRRGHAVKFGVKYPLLDIYRRGARNCQRSRTRRWSGVTLTNLGTSKMMMPWTKSSPRISSATAQALRIQSGDGKE